MEDLLKEAQELQHKIVEWRRILHRYPETGLVLPKTADFVTKQLTAAGIAYKTYKNHSGITAVIGKGENNCDQGRYGRTSHKGRDWSYICFCK